MPSYIHWKYRLHASVSVRMVCVAEHLSITVVLLIMTLYYYYYYSFSFKSMSACIIRLYNMYIFVVNSLVHANVK